MTAITQVPRGKYHLETKGRPQNAELVSTADTIGRWLEEEARDTDLRIEHSSPRKFVARLRHNPTYIWLYRRIKDMGKTLRYYYSDGSVVVSLKDRKGGGK